MAALAVCAGGALALATLSPLTVMVGLLIGLLALIAGVALATLHHERRSRLLLADLRAAIQRISPHYAQMTSGKEPATGTEGLQNEIRMLTEQWTEFCHHCQNVHDSQLLHAEHLATLGELAAGLAHEIRNPLAGIAGVIEMLTRDFPKDHPDRAILNDLKLEVRRIEKTLTELLAYARPKPPQLAPCDVEETIAHTLRLAQYQLGGRQVEFSVHVAPKGLTIPADTAQIHEVLLNLVLNAVQAIDRGGKISIEALVRESGRPNLPSQAEICVEDNGQGIPPQQIGDIFRPFFTTKRGGTGLGLSLSRRIITAHGGTLVAESVPGKGSRFTIRIPMGSVSPHLTQISLPEPEMVGAGTTSKSPVSRETS